MSQHRLQRPGRVDLAFEGELLADATSHMAGQQRWQELRLYRTDSGKYVLEEIGRTEVPHEIDHRRVWVLDTPGEVRTKLERRGTLESTGKEVTYLTHTALDLLDEASEKDPSIRQIAVEEI
jgi:hypothetical protein